MYGQQNILKEHVGLDFSFCLLIFVKAGLGSVWSKTEYFFSGRQAFASSTNMASSDLRCIGVGVSYNSFGHSGMWTTQSCRLIQH